MSEPFISRQTCECGCGAPTSIAKTTRRGYVKGEAMRFVQGHHLRTQAYKDALYTPERNGKIAAAHRDGRTPNPAPALGEFNARWRGDEVGYVGVHIRLATQRGPASEQVCAICGRPADEWAVNQAHDAVRMGVHSGRTKPYSPDLDAYPLCRSCHRKADRNGGYRG